MVTGHLSLSHDTRRQIPQIPCYNNDNAGHGARFIFIASIRDVFSGRLYCCYGRLLSQENGNNLLHMFLYW